ncbi:unnamed protein product [Spirodela intermedia]|uniref:Uncharacterized protein n=1 Tax=Spirodela intermedia TaxID=51605 RepID=A0A7I8KJ11_SPIIN|nr:unnamed protein product [Spirodela intermedia]
MARRHLRELLREEQEPFALQRFIDERRCQLRGAYTKVPPSPRRRHHHWLLRGRASPSFILLRDPLDCKKSPLSRPPQEKTRGTGSQTAAALLLEATTRIQKLTKQKQERGRRKRPAGRKKGPIEEPSAPFGLGFLASVLRQLVLRRRRREIRGDEERRPSKATAELYLEWEPCHGEKGGAAQRASPAATRTHRGEPDNARSGWFLLADRAQKKLEEDEYPQRSEWFGCGVLECHPSESDSGGPPPSVSGVPFIQPASIQWLRPDDPSPDGPSLELRTPPASPTHRRTELFGGRPGEEKEEQYSPVSVLDPPSDEEEEEDEDHHVDDSHRPEGEEGGGDEEDDGHVDSFDRSLAMVQKAKQELLCRLRRFERLAHLDPVELDRRLAEEEGDDDDQDLVRVVLGPPGDARKFAALTEETAELELRRVNGIEMMVEMDLRREGDGWRRFPDQVAEVAAAVSSLLLAELVAEDFVPLTGGSPSP